MNKTIAKSHPVLGTYEDENYIVVAKTHPYGTSTTDLVYWLDISRKDLQPVFHWPDLQRIKNEIVGVGHEGFQMFPPETKLVDEANHYHMFVFRDPTHSLGYGFKYRKVK